MKKLLLLALSLVSLSVCADETEQKVDSVFSNSDPFTADLTQLNNVGSILSDDGKLRIVSWNNRKDDGNFEYYTYLIFKKNNKTKPFVHKLHCPIATKPNNNGKYTANNWYGSIYYNAFATKTGYLLLGYQTYKDISRVKMIEPLAISKKEVVFGNDIFILDTNKPDKPQSRAVFEYSSKAIMSITYDNAERRFVFDHLSPENPNMKGLFQYYGPDFSYDALKSKKKILASDSGYRHTKQAIEKMDTTFNYVIDRFADLQILRYKVPGFENLTLNQKLYIYHLTQAAEEGRDILFDQNFKFNLQIRNLLENIYQNYKGDRNTPDFKEFEVYLKRVWFSNGIHHHYSTNKILPGFSQDYFNELLSACGLDCEIEIKEAIFNPTMYAKRVNLDSSVDVIASSANNYYSGVTQKEAEDFYAAMSDSTDKTPISYGMNSRLEKDDKGNISENVWKADGLYGDYIKRIIYHLNNARKYADNDTQKHIIDLLVSFYTTGDLKTFDEYSIAWVKDTTSKVDFVNGFIETYGDALGLKASWESIVNFKNEEATKRTETISSNAQWFEDNSPVDNRFKKREVKGVSAKVITNAFLAGDCYPATPIGINLPNANWIRQVYGSKSVTIENIMDAYDEAAKGNGFAEEFYLHDADRNAHYKYGFITDVLHTDLHECLGHGSGQLLDGVSQDALKSYGATLEEARADLFGLYYMADSKLVELGLLPDSTAYQTAYYQYILNGMMTQLRRIPLGEVVEESHMRNRQLIASWVYEKGAKANALKWIEQNGKHYLEIYNYDKMRELFGELLREVQRIKSEGDYEAGKALVEKYGIIPNKTFHTEVTERYKHLDIAPYSGFVNPVYKLVMNADGSVKDVVIDYTENYTDQMLRYSAKNK